MLLWSILPRKKKNGHFFGCLFVFFLSEFMPGKKTHTPNKFAGVIAILRNVTEKRGIEKEGQMILYKQGWFSSFVGYFFGE